MNGQTWLGRQLRTSLRRMVAVLVVAGVTVALLAATWPSDAAIGITEHDETITVNAGPGLDGTVSLDAGLYLPAHTPAPAVIVAHGFGGTRHSVDDDAQRLARAGFVVLTYTARGFGASTGKIALDSLDYEVPDARALVDWLAGRDEVTQDGPGDPRVGVTGGSYGGALALMLAGTDPRVDAVAAVATWNNLQQALFPNDGAVKTTTGRDGVFKQQWTARLLSSVLADPGGGTPSDCGRLMPDLCAAYVQVAQSGRITSAMSTLLANSSPEQVVGNISAPTLLTQGEIDTLFGLDQADANARAIAANGTTVAMSWFAGGHSGGDMDHATRDRITDWFRYYLAAEGAEPSDAFWYAVPGPVAGRHGHSWRLMELPTYPGVAADSPGPSDALVKHIRLAPPGGPDASPQVIINPPGGEPAAITSLPSLGELGAAALGNLAAIPGQTATFVSEPLPETTVVAGSVTLTLSVAPIGGTADGAVLYLSVGTVADDQGGTGPAASGVTTPPTATGVAPVRIEHLPADGSPVTVAITLPAAVFQVDAGDRLAIRVATTNSAFAGPTAPGIYSVSLAGDGIVAVPTAAGTRLATDTDSATAGFAIAAATLALAIVLALIFVARPRRRRHDRGRPTGSVPADAAPLAVTGLAKQYPGGVTAVDEVTFRVEPGQVVGLLGPNGAGKTTTLRMVLGLITPSAGEVRVFGEIITPGAEVLSRVGSFVEGAGFLPHLSGRVNLELYWRATGRPVADAHLDEALAIAGLGGAVTRRVKTYSQGMRQRLAIAQAMLGLPDLLILDEPTNGLDPPQIHAMREVLHGYVATGRTVLVSSHLLSEVEQTCSHVVVISQGRTIASGTVAEMVAASGEMTIATPDPADALAALATLPGLGEAEPTPSGIAVDLGTVRMSTLLRHLLDAGVDITSAAPRNRLEDVFLDLVETAGAKETT